MKHSNIKKLPYSLLIVIIPLLLYHQLFSQSNGKISGLVVDSQTGRRLPAVNITLVGTQIGTATNEYGEYFILNVPPGLHILRAEMIGYKALVKTSIRVSIDLTTHVDFDLAEQIYSGEEVIAEAERPIIQPDISGSQRIISKEEIDGLPFTSIKSIVINNVSTIQTGMYDDIPSFQGECDVCNNNNNSLLIIDGFSMNDALTNTPYYHMNLEAVEEVSIVTGGYSAKYGNFRAGMINIVTRESGSQISAGANIQYSPSGLKHFGPMIYGHESPVVQPFVNVWDSEGNWDPSAPSNTGEGYLDYSSHGGQPKRYADFFLGYKGWNGAAQSSKYAGPHIGSPMQLYARWLWRHRSQDSIEELKKLAEMGIVEFGPNYNPNSDEAAWQQEGVEPDYKIQTTLSGPIPLLSKFVKTTFFFSYDREQMEYLGRPPQRVYLDNQFRGKITSQISPEIKLELHGFWSSQKGGNGGQGPDIRGFISNNPYRSLGAINKLWYPDCATTGQQMRQMYGMKWTHILLPQTFYTVRLSHSLTDYDMIHNLRNTAPIPGTLGKKVGLLGYEFPSGIPSSKKGVAGVYDGCLNGEQYADSMAASGEDGWDHWRNWAQIKIGDYWYDEAPKGFETNNWRDISGYYRMGSCNLRINDTYTRNWQGSGQLTSQIFPHHLIELGFDVKRDHIYQAYERAQDNSAAYLQFSEATEWSGSFHLSDKMEYSGFILNAGLRYEWTKTAPFPAIDPFGDPKDKVNGPFSDYLKAGNTIDTGDEAPDFNTYERIPLKSQFLSKLSPRLGVSHPISTTAKIFFNYGYLYQWWGAFWSYHITYVPYYDYLIGEMGNPFLEPLRNIQYELGYEHNLINKLHLRLTFYYRDMNNGWITPRFYFAENNPRYWIGIPVNGLYRDIRGIETSLELNRGIIPFISGWASFNYLVESLGEYGYDRYYEDPTLQPRIVPNQVSQPDIRPILRLNLDFFTPAKLGPSLGDNFHLLGGINASLLFTWRRGPSFTWNPAFIPLVEKNVRWRSYNRWDLRVNKEFFKTSKFRSVFYVDVRNLFNNKNMSKALDQDLNNWANADIQASHKSNWAWDGHRWWKTEFYDYMTSLGYTADNQNNDGSFFDTIGVPGDHKDSRIDMPAFTPLTFLESRDIWFGFKIYF